MKDPLTAAAIAERERAARARDVVPSSDVDGELPTSPSEPDVDVADAVASTDTGTGTGTVWYEDRQTTVPDIERSGDVFHPDQAVLLRMHAAGDLQPSRVGRPTPTWLTPAAQFVYDDLKSHAGLLRKRGYAAVVIYTGSHGERRSHGRYKRSTISHALRELRTAGLIDHGDELEPRGKPNGSKTWTVR